MTVLKFPYTNFINLSARLINLSTSIIKLSVHVSNSINPSIEFLCLFQ
jgi:hypothetical protein